jgi:hypothetical protein
VAVPATGGVAIRYTQDSDAGKEAIMQGEAHDPGLPSHMLHRLLMR